MPKFTLADIYHFENECVLYCFSLRGIYQLLTGELPILSKKNEEKCKPEKIYYIYPATKNRALSQIYTPVHALKL